MSTSPVGTNLTASSSKSQETKDENFGDLLTFPSANREPTPPPTFSVQREQSKTRLYVGNLHMSVDEHTLIQVFKKYGKITKMDFLFHKSGPSKGKPRGYAFVEYSDKEEAVKALVNAHDKLLRGRKLVVTYANQAPPLESSAFGTRSFHRRSEAPRPTALSLIKTHSQPGKTEDKIAMLEAKLRQMEGQQGHPDRSGQPLTASMLPAPHPSLPLKPPVEQQAKSASATPSQSSARVPSGSGIAPTKSQTAPIAGPRGGGIRGSNVDNLGKKPTLEELMKSKQRTRGGLLGL